jgi:hypothetical protein
MMKKQPVQPDFNPIEPVMYAKPVLYAVVKGFQGFRGI